MLVKILTDYGEVPTVVVWDAGMSGRKELSADYKAQRSSRPDLLKLQWPHLRPLVEAFGYRNISVEGFEADDVIAALVEQARGRGIPVMVVTGDRDAYQLVTDGVRIMTTSRGITDTKVYDRQGVIDRYGIPPELIPDFIGLKGDTSDNIPGVPGIGDKTASELLQRFGDLDTVLGSVDEISGAKRKQNLVEHADARAALEAARDDGARRPDRPRPRGRAHAPAGPREPAHGLPRVGAARPAAAARGGARGRRDRGDPAPRGARGADRAGQGERHARRRRGARGRRADPDRGGSRGPGRGAAAARAAVALRRLRRRSDRAGRRGRRPRRAGARGRRPPGRRPRREGARRRPREPRVRHPDRRLPARPGAPRVPARRAGRGARPGRDRRRRERRPRGARARPRRPPAHPARRARADRSR